MIGKALVAASLKPIMLSVLSHGEAYGYEIIHRIEQLSGGQLSWTAGTLYPVLHRLEGEGLVESFWQPSEAGPRRKYYHLTNKGEAAMASEKQQWMDVHSLLLKLWSPDFSFGS